MRRREFLAWLATTGIAIRGSRVRAADRELTTSTLVKKIPATGEIIPPVGMGTWLTFDVGDDEELRQQRLQVLKAFFSHGGGMIDSSPMYDSSEEVIGYCLRNLERKDGLFSATKVWIWGQSLGIRQMQRSMSLWGLSQMDLMQVHNLLDWKDHLHTLRKWKSEGKIRYIGVTTSHGRRHDDLEKIMKTESLDFVQFTYNVLDREAEQRLLPLARERGIAVIINRPFQGGSLFDHVGNRPLPDWAREIDCANWAQVFLKFIISHPAVTCAIPATTRVDHMNENMGARLGRLPDTNMRRKIASLVESF